MKKPVLCLLYTPFCLLLAACVAFEAGPQSEPTEALNTMIPPQRNTVESAPATIPASRTPEVVAPATVAAGSGSTEAGPTETPLTPAPSMVHAQGIGETLVLPGCYDLDKGVSVVRPDPACDFNILPGPDSGTIEVYPVQTAQLAYAGAFPEPPTPEQCAGNDAYSAEREIVAPMAAMYVCYRTVEGRTGYLHFTGADLQQAGTLTFDWLTFANEEVSGDTAAGGSDLVYRQETFGFQLALPETWAGYQTSEHTSAQDEIPDAGTICYTFPDHGPICVLKIDVWTKAAWSGLETIPPGYYLAENGQFVFAAGPHEGGGECVQLDEFQCDRYREIPAILAGFSTE